MERDQRPFLEGDDESREIDGQGQDPQERRRGHVRGDVGRHAQQQARRRGGQKHPGAALAPGHSRRHDGRGGSGWSGRIGEPPRGSDKRAHQEREGRVAAAPDRRLESEPGKRLQDEGVGQQSQEAAEVAGRIEDVGAAPSPHSPVQTPEPGLQQWRGGRERRERPANRQGQHAEQPQDRVRRRALAERGCDAERQGQPRQDQHGDMDRHLAAHAPQALQDVGVGVAQQQRDLEEGQAGVPHRRRAPQVWQQQLGHHRLDQEHQGGAGEHRAREQPRRQAERPRFGHCALGH